MGVFSTHTHTYTDIQSSLKCISLRLCLTAIVVVAFQVNGNQSDCSHYNVIIRLKGFQKRFICCQSEWSEKFSKFQQNYSNFLKNAVLNWWSLDFLLISRGIRLILTLMIFSGLLFGCVDDDLRFKALFFCLRLGFGITNHKSSNHNWNRQNIEGREKKGEKWKLINYKLFCRNISKWLKVKLNRKLDQ